jgi:hypothetical protein
MAGSSGSFVNDAVLYAGSISIALDNADGDGGGFVESSSGSALVCRQPDADAKITAAVTVTAAPRIPRPKSLITNF